MAAALTLTLAAVYLAAGMWRVAPGKAGYDWVKHTISELGEQGAATQRAAGAGLFLPVGLLMLVSAWLLRPVSPSAATLPLCIATGYLTAAIFPCDPGSPVAGSARQALHTLGGAVEYIGGGLALLVLADTLGPSFRAAGIAVLGTAVALTVLPSTSVRGVIQRAGEVCLFGGAAAAAWQLQAAPS